MNRKFKITNSVRYGSFSLIATAVVLVIIILANLAVNALPASYTSYTDDPWGIYEISDSSADLLKRLDDDVTIYVIATEDQSSEYHLMITEYVDRYSELSDELTVKHIDPELRPGFVGEYTDEELSTDYTHLIVVNHDNDRSKVIAFSDIVYTEYTTEEYYYLVYYYGYTGDNPTHFDLESCLLNAIDYVTADTLPTLYYTTGHGETSLDSGFTYYASYENIELSALDMSEITSIPEDAGAVIIYAPTADFSAKEIEMLKEYTERGGNIVLSTSYNTSLHDRYLDNLYGFAKENYGMDYYDVRVYEGNSNNYSSSPANILVTSTSSVPSVVSSSGYIKFGSSHAITVSDTLPENVTVTKLFTTTSSGFAKTVIDANTENRLQDGDIEGQFTLGAMSTLDKDDVTSTMWWFSSTDALDIANTLSASYANAYVAIYVMTESVEKDESISVGSTILSIDMLTVSSDAAKVWGIIIIGIIPGVILVYGIYVRYKRSRR